MRVGTDGPDGQERAEGLTVMLIAAAEAGR
jgi:hypothetical protein